MGPPSLREGLAELGLAVPAPASDQLLAYRDELARWGRVHNLTSVREPERMVPVHLLDSLALSPHVRGPRLADVGSGGGLPGVPLAIVHPGLEVRLIEPRAKRAAFLAHVVRILGLRNVIVERSRVEDVPRGAGFDTVTTRAFGTLAEFVRAAAHLRGTGGCLLAAKGRYPRDELAALPPGWRAHAAALRVPGVDAMRHAVCLEPEPAVRDTAAAQQQED
jgi:16S rRNA (guanine527-N7)-methyltransferase